MATCTCSWPRGVSYHSGSSVHTQYQAQVAAGSSGRLAEFGRCLIAIILCAMNWWIGAWVGWSRYHRQVLMRAKSRNKLPSRNPSVGEANDGLWIFAIHKTLLAIGFLYVCICIFSGTVHERRACLPEIELRRTSTFQQVNRLDSFCISERGTSFVACKEQATQKIRK